MNKIAIALSINQVSGVLSLFGLVAVVVIWFLATIPAWMHSQEVIVITEATLLILIKPDIFSIKTSQLNLSHVEDVNILRGFLGNILNFGDLNIETAGEMENFEFRVIGDVDNVARLIINCHENYMAAMQSGHIQTTIDPREPIKGNAWHGPIDRSGSSPIDSSTENQDFKMPPSPNLGSDIQDDNLNQIQEDLRDF
jgi:hypothetical protein